MEKIYRREEYLKKLRGFYNDDMIKVITGIRRCGKSYLLKSVIDELKEKGVEDENIIYIELDKKEYLDIDTPSKLERVIDEKLKYSSGFKYLFVDEIQNVKNYESLINAYKEEGDISIFITGSNSYLLSGELATKLIGRYIEIEMLPLNFFEYVDMKRFIGKEVDENIYREFESYIRNGGFPGSLKYDSYEDKMTYTTNVIKQIFEKDIKKHNKIKDVELFERIEKFIINNFGSIISTTSIKKYLEDKEKIKVDRRTIKKYIDILVKAKIIYPCELFDIKSKSVLKGDKKYYLADLSIYFSLNTDNRINYGPVLENILYSYLKAKSYDLSIGRIGNLECDFIARLHRDNYFYIQVSKTIDSTDTEEREYKPFYSIKDMYPRYLFTTDILLQNRDGVKNVNIVDFTYNNLDL